MHARIAALLLILKGLWLEVKVWVLRRLVREHPTDAQEPAAAAPPPVEAPVAVAHAESEFDMSDPSEMNSGRPEEPAVDAANDEDIEAALRSMQGELENLSGMLEQDQVDLAATTPPPADEHAADVLDAAELEAALEAASAADAERELAAAAEELTAETPLEEAQMAAPADEEVLTNVRAADVLAAALPADEPLAVADEVAEVAADFAEPVPAAQPPKPAPAPQPAPAPVVQATPSPASQVNIPPAASVQPVQAETAAPQPQSIPQAERVQRSVSAFASAARQAFDEPAMTPQPAPAPFAASTPRRARSNRGPATGVESAILNFGAFLQDEVSGLWGDAQAALADIVAYRDQMQQSAQRIEALEREIRNMRDDMAAARRDARTVQQQMQNLRDDAARARQRADSAALDAQSAADRAISAAREIESLAALHHPL